MGQIAKVAIIMPAYNCSKTIERAINSVINQSYNDWHLYIVNDASKDRLLDTLDKYSNNIKITLINNETNKGAAESRNIGIHSGQEEIVAFLDSDDEWHTEKLKLQIDCLKNGSDFVMSAYNYIKEDNHSRSINYKKTHLQKKDFLKKKFRVCFSSVCYRRFNIAFKKIGHEDYIFINDLFSKYSQARVLSEALVNYYSIEGSLSNNKKKAISWHLDCLRYLFNNNVKIGYYFLLYIFNALLFKWKVR